MNTELKRARTYIPFLNGNVNNSTDSYLFLGLPASGKTTCFSLMAQQLQDLANRKENMRFRYLPTLRVNSETGEESREELTSDFIEECMSQLKSRQSWVDKTQSYEAGYSFELEMSGRFFIQKHIIEYHDYPGEAFELAFGDFKNPGNPSSGMAEIANIIRGGIGNAKGIFLILDADALFNSHGNPILSKALTRLFRHIHELNPKVKVAIIFNKLELFGDNIPDFITMLRSKYSNVYAHLPENHKFFNVFPLGKVETGEDGNVYPPKKLISNGLLQPIRWMIGF